MILFYQVRERRTDCHGRDDFKDTAQNLASSGYGFPDRGARAIVNNNSLFRFQVNLAPELWQDSVFKVDYACREWCLPDERGDDPGSFCCMVQRLF